MPAMPGPAGTRADSLPMNLAQSITARLKTVGQTPSHVRQNLAAPLARQIRNSFRRYSGGNGALILDSALYFGQADRDA